MLRKSLKFSHAKFEYFILQINPNTELTEITTKLNNFKKLEQKNNFIVLGIDGIIKQPQLEEMVVNVKSIAEGLNLKLHSILPNENLTVNVIAHIPVIDLPSSSRFEHIYNKSLISNEPVRSGIKLENDGDIIVTSFVSDNAEIIATGNIHVYGEARGRLIAGSSGDKNARIFVSKFNAELIAIGGLYRVMEDKLQQNVLHNAVMISLDNKNKLVIEPIGG
ncbi:MAG: septum site-determining protein MinC [Burkholderiales bacterium]|nr:septum site-determining protein MinC [Burkholderiales bacterium]